MTLHSHRPSRLLRPGLVAFGGVLFVLAAAWLTRATWRPYLGGERPTVCEAPAAGESRLITTTPADGAVDAPVDRPVTADVALDGTTLDPATVSTATVALLRVRDRSPVPAAVGVGADGRSITLTPASPLGPRTNYAFYVTQGVKDRTGAAVPAAQTAFSTGAAGATAAATALPAFEKVALPLTAGLGVTCLEIGPDGRLWAAVDDGRLLRFTVAADGTVSDRQEIRSLVDANDGRPRLIGGFAFDPASTADAPVVWVTHTSFGFINMGDWQGKVSRLSGPGLKTAQDVVVNLPRSARDHVIHQPHFGPDGCLYFQSGSMSSYGDPDGFWGWRREHPFGAAVVRVDPKRLPDVLPIDVKTPEDAGRYDRNAPDAPVTIYAGGMRVAFDLCWHRNGHLYAPVNGSSAGGNTPWRARAPQLWAVAESEHDWLFRVEAGGYSGHPNPSQGTGVLNGGNPTAGADFAEVTQYPVGTMPEKNWTPAVFDFGTHVSPDGVIEYRATGPADAALDGALLVCRYNVGNDLLAFTLDAAGGVAAVIANVPGCGDLQNPLDLCQDVARGNLYVSEYGKHAVTLLRAEAVKDRGAISPLSQHGRARVRAWLSSRPEPALTIARLSPPASAGRTGSGARRSLTPPAARQPVHARRSRRPLPPTARRPAAATNRPMSMLIVSGPSTAGSTRRPSIRNRERPSIISISAKPRPGVVPSVKKARGDGGDQQGRGGADELGVEHRERPLRARRCGEGLPRGEVTLGLDLLGRHQAVAPGDGVVAVEGGGGRQSALLRVVEVGRAVVRKTDGQRRGQFAVLAPAAAVEKTADAAEAQADHQARGDDVRAPQQWDALPQRIRDQRGRGQQEAAVVDPGRRW